MGLFDALLKAKQPKPQLDEQGTPLPQRRKRSLFENVATVALPAATTLAAGYGIVPGMLSGIGANRARTDKQYAQDVDVYAAQKKSQSEAGKLALDEKYKMGKLDVAKTMANKPRGGGSSKTADRDEWIMASQIIDNAKANGLSDEEIKKQFPNAYFTKQDYERRKFYQQEFLPSDYNTINFGENDD